jgi:nucleoid-associated protein YgaU
MATNLEQLKQKYAPAFRVMEQQQVRLQNVNMQGEKLYVRGEAPSQDAKNKVWDQIKLVDPTYADLICDITASPQQAQTSAPRTQTAGAAVSGGQAARTYTVKPGDTLSKISREMYGDSGQYLRIFEANRDKLNDPNKIQVGQELVIPG